MANKNVAFVRKELQDKLPYYTLIDDCLKGEQAIKLKKQVYLPIPNEQENDDESTRYEDYLTRAVFYNVTARTLSGITGLVYLKEANYKLPVLLEQLKVDCTGEGISLPQLAKRALRLGMSFGRAGIFVDYPQMDESSTVTEIETGQIQPIFRLYRGDDIINWRTFTENGKISLSLVVLKEKYVDEKDEFVNQEYLRYRVLRIEDKVFTVEIIDAKTYKTVSKVTPLDSEENPFTVIPFHFIGAENNDSEIDHPPIYDMAVLNIAHYRNSADYEESVFTVGQPTIWYSGVTEEWATDILGGKMYIGGRGGLPLPENGQAGLLQVAPNTLSKEAMDQKEAQMLALGAKLVQATSGNRTTATEAQINDASETSILVNVTKNVSDAMKGCLLLACQYVGADSLEVEFSLEADLELTKLSSQDLLALVKSWQDGAISQTELRYNLRKSGIAYGVEVDRLAELNKEKMERQDLLDKQMAIKQNTNNK